MRSFFRYYADSDVPSRFDCMFHLSPREVVASSLYKEWMQRFGSSVDHVFLGSGAAIAASPFVASTRHVRKLHTHAPALFPRLMLLDDRNSRSRSSCESLLPEPEAGADYTEASTKTTTPSIMRGYPLMRYVLGPSSQRGWSRSAPVYPSDTDLDEDARRHVSEVMAGKHAEPYEAAVQSLQRDRASCGACAVSIAPSSSETESAGSRSREGEGRGEGAAAAGERYDMSSSANAALLRSHQDNEIWFLGKRNTTHIYLNTYISMYTYVCICLCRYTLIDSVSCGQARDARSRRSTEMCLGYS